MNNLKKEQFLHKVVAGSGFLFALCILPVAQYVLTHSGTVPSSTVAGVSTASPSASAVTEADIASDPAKASACAAEKQKELSDLQVFYDGKKQNLLTTEQNAINMYKNGPQATGQDEAALDQFIQTTYEQPYQQNLEKVNAAVATKQAQINASVCGLGE